MASRRSHLGHGVQKLQRLELEGVIGILEAVDHSQLVLLDECVNIVWRRNSRCDLSGVLSDGGGPRLLKPSWSS